jgi:hypothetical protein
VLANVTLRLEVEGVGKPKKTNKSLKEVFVQAYANLKEK